MNLEHGLRTLEVNLLDEKELEQWQVLGHQREMFERVSVHSPTKNRSMDEEALVQFCIETNAPIIVHPDTVHDWGLWRELGVLLLVENNDGRKDFGSNTKDLDKVFQQVPNAGLCLDVSHAMHAGGLLLLQEIIKEEYWRLEQIHVGCGCGAKAQPVLEKPLLEGLGMVLAAAGMSVPTIIERRSSNAEEREQQLDSLEQVYQEVLGAHKNKTR